MGKFDFRKQLPLALKIIKNTNNSKIHLNIYGSGNDLQIKENRILSEKLNIKTQISWHGNVSNLEIAEAMKKAHLFLFTSVSEDTSTVVLEAISNGLPVMCFDTCGMGYVITDKVGKKIPLTNPLQSIKDFAEAINILERDRGLLKQMSENCKQRQEELSWDNKALQMVELYNKVLKG